jgi:cytosine/adenosine deaminase-related metal-dependent hydrolase
MLLLADEWLAASLDRVDEAACDRLFARFRQAGTWQVPTLVQARGWFRADTAPDPRDALVPPAMLADWRRAAGYPSPARRAAGRAVVRRQLALVGAMHRAGVGILAGTDASDEPWVYPGASLHDELALLVEAGLSPLDALRAATLGPARYLGAADTLGRVAPGCAADLVLLDGDPLADIRNTARIRAVVLRGRLLDRAALDRLLDGARRTAAGRR